MGNTVASLAAKSQSASVPVPPLLTRMIGIDQEAHWRIRRTGYPVEIGCHGVIGGARFGAPHQQIGQVERKQITLVLSQWTCNSSIPARLAVWMISVTDSSTKSPTGIAGPDNSSTIGRTKSAETCRFDDANTNPIRSAPASHAVFAWSRLRNPQILTNGRSGSCFTSELRAVRTTAIVRWPPPGRAPRSAIRRPAPHPSRPSASGEHRHA